MAIDLSFIHLSFWSKSLHMLRPFIEIQQAVESKKF